MKINIANKLKELRKNKNLTQEDLASYLGVSFQAVSRWERNEGYPDIELLPIIANYFEVSVDELLGVNDIKNKLSIDDINNKYKDLAGAELIEAMKKEIKAKDKNLKGKMETQGTTPRRLTDLIGSLCDLTSGSGDKGTPIVFIQGYFDNFADE